MYFLYRQSLDFDLSWFKWQVCIGLGKGFSPVTNGDQVVWCHMALLGKNELICRSVWSSWSLISFAAVPVQPVCGVSSVDSLWTHLESLGVAHLYCPLTAGETPQLLLRVRALKNHVRNNRTRVVLLKINVHKYRIKVTTHKN